MSGLQQHTKLLKQQAKGHFTKDCIKFQQVAAITMENFLPTIVLDSLR